MEYPQTVAKMVKGLPGIDTIITGHGNVMTWKDAEEFGRFHQEWFGAIQAAMKSGKSVDEAAASIAASLNDKYPAYGLQGAFKDRVKEDVGIV